MANPNPQTPAARKAVRGRRARSAGNVAPTPEERHRMIAEAAYFRALRRTDGDGDPLTDWLEAEREIDSHGTDGG